MNSPYAPPNAPVVDPDQRDSDEVEYGGFWIRVGAALIDSVLVMLIIVPIVWWIYGPERILGQSGSMIGGPVDVLISYVFPAVATVAFWLTRQATPGKMLLSLKIVDARTLGALSTPQAIGRYFGYYLSTMVFFLGLIWVGFDRRKQGWHDKLAGTVVIRTH